MTKKNNLKKDFTLRPFHPSDQAAVKSLVLSGLAERFKPFKPEFNTDVNDIANNFSVFLVVCFEGEFVATGGLKFETKTSAKVVRMSTMKAYRRLGIARSILEELESTARSQGIIRLTLVTGKDWTEAVYFYERHDFVMILAS
jgi:GNAT superfamily N-acetyltransferase